MLQVCKYPQEDEHSFDMMFPTGKEKNDLDRCLKGQTLRQRADNQFRAPCLKTMGQTNIVTSSQILYANGSSKQAAFLEQ